MSGRRAHGERLLRAAMRCHPLAFRRAYEREMVEYYRAVVAAEASRRSGVWRLWFLWKCVASAVWRGLVQRFRRHGRARNKALDVGTRAHAELRAAVGTIVEMDHSLERSMRRAGRLQELRQDVAYALRGLLRNPAFSVTVLLSIGLGIGANTAVFTLMDAVLLRTLPVPDAEQLIVVGDATRVRSMSSGSPGTDLFSYPLYRDLRDANTVVRGLAASGRAGQLDVVIPEAASGGGGGTEQPTGRLVSGNYFSVLGVRARLGRTFTAEEDAVAGGAPVVVISDRYWRQRFGADSGVLGRSMIVNGTSYTVVGVTGPAFHGEVVGQLTDLWLPLTMQPAVNRNEPWLEDRTVNWLLLIGRLAPGMSLERARAEFNTLTYRLLDEHNPPAADADPSQLADRERVAVGPGARGLSRIRSAYAEPLGTLMVAVLLVLLLVCANVANLLFARGAARARELGIRMALGAGRRRLVQQLVTESLLLATLGGAFGLLLAWWGSRTLLALAVGPGGGTPLDIGLDLRVLGFASALTLTTALLFGLAPALRTTRVALATAARTRGLASGLSGKRPGRPGPAQLLVIAQVALSLVLLVATGLLVRSTRRLESQDVGLDRDRLLIVRVDAAPLGIADEARMLLFRTLQERIRRVPGVVAVAYSENGIFSGTESGTTVRVEGFEARTAEDSSAAYDRIGPQYFETIGARLITGRDTRATDSGNGTRVIVINESMASHYFANRDALGGRVTVDGETFEIVGVAADVKDHGLRGDPARRMYIPLEESVEGPPMFINFEVRADGDPAQLAESVRRAILHENGSLRVLSASPLVDLMRESISQDRLVARVISFFGVLALGLAAFGLYGILAYATVRRTSEFGLRLALGAEPRDLRRMVLRDAMLLVGAGAAVGLPFGLLATRLLENQLYRVSSVDPVSIAVATLVLLTSAAAAGYLPASRAARVGPLTTLRAE